MSYDKNKKWKAQRRVIDGPIGGFDPCWSKTRESRVAADIHKNTRNCSIPVNQPFHTTSPIWLECYRITITIIPKELLSIIGEYFCGPILSPCVVSTMKVPNHRVPNSHAWVQLRTTTIIPKRFKMIHNDVAYGGAISMFDTPELPHIPLEWYYTGLSDTWCFDGDQFYFVDNTDTIYSESSEHDPTVRVYPLNMNGNRYPSVEKMCTCLDILAVCWTRSNGERHVLIYANGEPSHMEFTVSRPVEYMVIADRILYLLHKNPLTVTAYGLDLEHQQGLKRVLPMQSVAIPSFDALTSSSDLGQHFFQMMEYNQSIYIIHICRVPRNDPTTNFTMARIGSLFSDK